MPDSAARHSAARHDVPAPPPFGPVLHHRAHGMAPGDAISPPLVHASAFHLPGAGPDGAPVAPGADVAFQYARWGTPTWAALEAALGVLEDADVAVVPSGMAAIASVLLSHLRPGDRALLPSDGYGATRALAAEHLSPIGVHVDLVPTPALASADLAGYDLVFVETPSNPGLRAADIADVAARAHANGRRGGAGALVVVDNTSLTPLGQRPLDLGADVVVASDTKALNGHSDALGGHVASRDADVLARVRGWRTLTGAILGSHEAWLIHRGLETLEVRFARMCASALAVAELAAGHPAVRAVAYPGLPDHPDAEVVARQTAAAGSVVGLEFADAAAAERFLAAARLVVPQTSFGGTHTSAERRARWGDDVPAGFVRLSVGVEPTAELLADVERALEAAG